MTEDTLNISPTRLYWTPFSPNNMYVIDRNNLLHTYILGKSGTERMKIHELYRLFYINYSVYIIFIWHI